MLKNTIPPLRKKKHQTTTNNNLEKDRQRQRKHSEDVVEQFYSQLSNACDSKSAPGS